MSDIEWSPWIRHVGEECPVEDKLKGWIRVERGDEIYESNIAEWDWREMAGGGTITRYRIPMSDYKRITGMPEWSEAPEWAQFLAQDEDGEWTFFAEAPKLGQSKAVWVQRQISYRCKHGGNGHVLGEFIDTLQERPCEASMTVEAEDFRLGENDQWAKHFMAERAGGSLASHPNSEPDADQYSVGADTFPQDARDELLKRAQERNLNPYDAPGFLEAALGHMEDRKTTYDAPEGERSMGKTVAAFNAIRGRDLSEEEGWLFMVLLKAVRTQQGAFRADNYEDGAAYFALQGEAAARDRGHE